MKRLYLIEIDGFRSHLNELQVDVLEDVTWFYNQVKKDTIARIIPDHDILEAAERIKRKQELIFLTSDFTLDDAEDLIRDSLAEIELYRTILAYVKVRFL